MTVTTLPSQLKAAADREAAFGNHAYAAALYHEAGDNASAGAAVQAAILPAPVPALVGPNTGAAIAAQAAFYTSERARIASARVKTTGGSDGRTIITGPVA